MDGRQAASGLNAGSGLPQGAVRHKNAEPAMVKGF